MLKGSSVTIMSKVSGTECPAISVTISLMFKVPATVAVPEYCRVEGLNVIHPGKALLSISVELYVSSSSTS